jgi:hypothetical protein
MPATTSNGIRIVYDDLGRGEPALLFLPGRCANRTVFADLAAECSRHRPRVTNQKRSMQAKHRLGAFLLSLALSSWALGGEPPTPPQQATRGPGSSRVLRISVVKARYGEGARMYWILSLARGCQRSRR